MTVTAKTQSKSKTRLAGNLSTATNHSMPSLAELRIRYPQITGIHPACEALPLIQPVHFRELVAAIERDGQLDPIKITEEGVVLDGRHRLAACYSLDFEPILQIVEDDPWAIAIGNVVRRHLTVGQRAAFAATLLQVIAPAAAKRKLANLRNASTNAECQSSDDRGRAMEIAGREVGVSRDSVDKFVRLPPNQQQAVKDGRQSLNAAAKAAGLISPKKQRDGRCSEPSQKVPGAIDRVYESPQIVVLRHRVSLEEAVVMRSGDGTWRYQLATSVKPSKGHSHRTAVSRASLGLLTRALPQKG